MKTIKEKWNNLTSWTLGMSKPKMRKRKRMTLLVRRRTVDPSFLTKIR